MPGVFLHCRATLIYSSTLRTTTVQVVITAEAAVPTGNEIPMPLVDWFLHDALHDW